jgi:uncharacterized membrane protein
MAKKKTKKKAVTHKANDESRVFALIGAILPILGYIIVVLAGKKSDYIMHYAREGVGLGITWIIVWIVSLALVVIPVVGWIIGALLQLIMVVIWLIGIIYSISGSKKNIPIAETVTKQIF